MALRGAISIARRANPSLLSSKSPLFNTHLPNHGLHLLSSSTHHHIPKSGFGYYSMRAVHGASVEPVVNEKRGDGKEGSDYWKVKMLYDGDCPLCMREVNMLRERDKQYKAIKFVDISSEEYSPEDNQGLDYKTAMGRIHAILSDGTVVRDVEAFRRLYEAVGLGWLYAITKYKPIATIADAVYGVWAKYRLQITGRPPLEEVLELRRKNKEDACNDKNACKM
ncbi:hypothetical protein AKJ16_DCAP02148 [Drosera capensis]